MKLFSEEKEYKLYQGSMLDMLEAIEPETIDSIVCDPPYGLTSITKRFGKENSAECQYGKDGSFQRLSKGFMGQEWDGSGIEYNIETWRKCYEVLKPGGYLLAFGGSRTFHRIACAIEDAGYKYIGIDLSKEYLQISKARIEYVINSTKNDGQTTIFDYE